MANGERDEVDLTIDGKSYTLVLTTNAMCEVETVMSTPLRRVSFADVLIASRRNSVAAIRAIFWASLRERHRDVTLEHAGELTDRAGGAKSFAEKFAAMVLGAVPAESDLDALGLKTKADTARPRKARPRRVGIGANSTAKSGSRG
jgi:hypothetical protein